MNNGFYEPENYMPPQQPNQVPYSRAGAPHLKASENNGVKYDEDKMRPSLLPMEALQEVIKVLTYGSKKYAAFGRASLTHQAPSASTQWLYVQVIFSMILLRIYNCLPAPA